MKIFFLELKKLWNDKKYLLTILGLFILNGILFWGMLTYYTPVNSNEYKEIYKSIEKMDTETAYQTLLAEEIEGDENTYRQIVKEVEDVLNYPSYVKQIGQYEDTTANISIFQQGDAYARKNIQKTSEDFKKLKILPDVTLGPVEGLENAFGFIMTDLCLIIVLLMSVQQLIGKEKQSGMFLLLRTSEKGRSRIAVAKVVTLFVILAGMSFAFIIENLAIAKMQFGLGDLERSIQSLSSYQSCLIPLNWYEFFFLIVIAKTIVLFLIGLILVILSYLFQSTILIYGVFLLIYGGSLFLHQFIQDSSWIDFLKYINLFYFLKSDQVIGTYHNINLFGEPVEFLHIFFTIMGIGIIVLCILFFTCFCQKNYLKTIKNSKEKDRKRISYSKQVFWEVKKNLYHWKVGIIFLFFFCIQLQYISGEKEALREEEMYEWQYVRQMGGKLTEEKAAKIEAEKELFENFAKQSNELQIMHKTGKIEESDYFYQNTILQEKRKPERGFLNFYQRYLRLKDTKNPNLCFERQYKRNFFDLDVEVREGFVLLLWICFLTSVCIAREYETKMIVLQKTYGEGIQTVFREKKKYLLAGYLIGYVAAVAPDYIVNFQKFGMWDFGMPVYCLEVYENMPAWITVWMLCLAIHLLRFLFGYLILYVLLWIAQRAKNVWIAMTLDTFLLIFPALLYYFSMGELWKVSVLSGFAICDLFLNPSILASTCAFLYIVIGMIAWRTFAWKRGKG